MVFALLLLYITLSYVYPGEVFPALAPFRMTYWAGILGLAASVVWVAARRRSVLMIVQPWLLAIFVVWVIASTTLAERWLGAPMEVIQRIGPTLTMFVLALVGVDSLPRLRIVAGLIVLLSLVLMLQGAAAYHLGINEEMFLYDPLTRAEYVAAADQSAGQDEPPDEISDEERELLSEEFEGSLVQRIRGLGQLHDPNDLALGFVLALPLLTSFWVPKARLRNLLLVIAPLAALAYGVFLTHSRGGTIALAVVLLGLMTATMGRAKAAVPWLMAVAVLVALNFTANRGFSDDSATGRVVAWTEGFEMLKSQPVFGVGYGQFIEHHTLTAHNSFVLCFAEAGIVGYFFWIGILAITFVQLGKLKHLPEDSPFDTEVRRWALGLQLSLLAFMVAGFFLSRTFTPLLYMILGMSIGLILIARDAGRPVWSPTIPRMGTLVLGCELASILFIYAIVKMKIV